MNSGYASSGAELLRRCSEQAELPRQFTFSDENSKITLSMQHTNETEQFELQIIANLELISKGTSVVTCISVHVSSIT